MLTCIACNKQLNSANNGSFSHREDEDALETPKTRQAIKALTAQVYMDIPRLISSLFSVPAFLFGMPLSASV